MILARRRPLLRGAIIGGSAYAIGKNAANNANREQEQEARINDLENSQSTQPVQSSPAPQAQTNITASLSQLAELKNSGALTDQEFEEAKAKLLNS